MVIVVVLFEALTLRSVYPQDPHVLNVQVSAVKSEKDTEYRTSQFLDVEKVRKSSEEEMPGQNVLSEILGPYLLNNLR